MMALNCAAPTLDHWGAEQRLLIAGQALVLGKVLSRSVRKFLYEEELLFPRPPMKLNLREREILTLAAAGQTSKEIAATWHREDHGRHIRGHNSHQDGRVEPKPGDRQSDRAQSDSIARRRQRGAQERENPGN